MMPKVQRQNCTSVTWHSVKYDFTMPVAALVLAVAQTYSHPCASTHHAGVCWVGLGGWGGSNTDTI